MENPLYVALSRQIVTQRHMEVIANNLANISSPGYKSEQMMFGEHVMAIDRKNSISFVLDVGLARNMRAGKYNQTGSPLDVAIKGRGWFKVETREGERYTRAGHFEIASNGTMVTPSGNPIVGDGDRPIIFTPGDTNIVITADGKVTANGKDRGRLLIVQFDEPHKMKKVSGNLYSSTSEMSEAKNASIVQGMIEESNVQPIIEIANMITALRSYQGNQKLIEREHERQRKAIEKLTRET